MHEINVYLPDSKISKVLDLGKFAKEIKTVLGMDCMSFLKGEINYLLIHYLKDEFRQIEQIMLF